MTTEGLVWAIRIICISLSCDPIPAVVGYFDDEPECVAVLRQIDSAWKPSMGIYEMKCFTRAMI